jgi:uncharacterized membrane protein (UPF0127 family)
MTKFLFNHKGKRFNIEVNECRTVLERVHGLMFRRKSRPLLFLFNGEIREGIHSFFCVPFIAIWFNKSKIIEAKLVNPWRFYVVPRKSFDKLLEIPINSGDFSRVKIALSI